MLCGGAVLLLIALALGEQQLRRPRRQVAHRRNRQGARV